MNIRPVTAGEMDLIADIHWHAFASSPMGHNGEAHLVRDLQADGDVVCSLVAEVDGALIGHVLFSKMAVEANSIPLRAAGLAPVAVLPQAQHQGVGGALIRAGLDQLAADGFQISFVLGHPDYYPRFGYRAELAAPFASPFAGPHFMARYLDSSLALPQRGSAEYAPAFARMG